MGHVWLWLKVVWLEISSLPVEALTFAIRRITRIVPGWSSDPDCTVLCGTAMLQG